MRSICLFILFFVSSYSWSAPFSYPVMVDLNNPKYNQGVISTEDGGIITSTDIRIQGKQIIYTHKIEEGTLTHFVTAEGDLMLEKEGMIYTGKRLEYDFPTKVGIIYGGKTAIDFWFIGGEVIKVHPDCRLEVQNAFLTTSEKAAPYWKIESREIEVEKHYLVTAKGATTARFLDIPIAYFPPLPFRLNIKTLSDAFARYQIDWETGLYPRIRMRYQIYSWKYLKLFAGLSIRPSKGVGVSFESKYRSATHRSRFITKSYVDHDAFYRDDNPDRARIHYRLQGQYRTVSANERSFFFAEYDKLNDKNLQTDFKRKSFTFDTVKETKMQFYQKEEWSHFLFQGKKRINSFQTMKQALPQTLLAIKPLSLGSTGIIADHRFQFSYFDYVFAKELSIPSFDSLRISSKNTFYRPFHHRFFSFTPLAGFRGIFYTSNRESSSSMQAVFHYSFDLYSKWQRQYAHMQHLLRPYFQYNGWTKPTLSPNKAYIFSIEDGYQTLNVVKAGIQQLFYLSHSPLFEPNLLFNLYIYAFLDSTIFQKSIPKIRAEWIWNSPSLTLHSYFGWNSEESVLDYANIGLAWTINAYFAIKSEFRHRSRFDWRKNSRDNFMMEVTRPIEELLHSPLSDGRNTFLTRLQIKIAPQWTARLETHIGWGRKTAPSYSAFKLDLFTTISSNWQLYATLMRSPAPKNKNTSFFLTLSLGNKPVWKRKFSGI